MLTIADWFCTQRTGDDVGGGGTGVELLKFKGLWLGYLSCGVRQKGEVMWRWGGGGGRRGRWWGVEGGSGGGVRKDLRFLKCGD
jgi:hypothetical protein